MATIGCVGYGLFGNALFSFFQELDYRVRAYDAFAPVPGAIAARSVNWLAGSAGIIFVAVPVAQMRATFAALKPLLGPRHVVADVGSVKVHPSEWMQETFGDGNPWVATHPLFGP